MKQNRCLEHQQEVVALCVDEGCDRKVKAVCPLELYNEHLNHKFENISKVHTEWSLYAQDIRDIAENVDRENVMKHMDAIINELMTKVREHLFLLRKEFEVKMAVYFDSKPVGKIRTALAGIQKCLDERYLELSHEEVEQAKFFIEVYGMKKLINDTHSQRTSFQKEVLVAFSKLKEEMFMDYPKFNALFKAKEFEYCDVIKKQKEELDGLRERYRTASLGLEGVMEQNKQTTYELNRAKNELSNKEQLLAETDDKLRLITKKYNEQAEQAIMKARQIQTKNIFGVYTSRSLYRVSDRVIRTGDKSMEWPNFADIGEASGKIWLRINRFDVGGWILLGIMRRQQVEKNEYEFDNYKLLGHGTYMMDNNRWAYSDTDESLNCKAAAFEFGQGDIIKMEVFEKESILKFSKMVYGWEEDKFEIKYTAKDKDPLFFCVAVKGEHTEVELI